ncbi:hypothetical protein THAOC_33213, partial [Thalassiosira oceanica]
MSERVNDTQKGPRPLVWGQPGCQNAQISAEHWDTAKEVEVAIGAHGVFPLPMGIRREGRHEKA